MAELLKVLGQAKPVLATWVKLYQVPADTQVVCSCIHMCCTAGGNDFASAQIRIGDVAEADRQFMYDTLEIKSTDAMSRVIGITMSAGDAVWVKSANGRIAFHLFGTEIF